MNFNVFFQKDILLKFFSSLSVFNFRYSALCLLFISIQSPLGSSFSGFFLFVCFLLLCNYSCPHFPPITLPILPTPTSHIQLSPIPLSSSMGPLYMFLDDLLPSFSYYPPPLWLLSICSLFPCFWLYFAHSFVLLIRFHL